MTATVESLPSRTQGLRSGGLKRPMFLRSRGCRLVVDQEGAARGLESLSEKRALFGFEQLWFYKVQAGIVVHAQRPDWAIRVSPRSIRFTGRIFDTEVAQSFEFYAGRSVGYFRRIVLRNAGQNPIRLRIFELIDPTAAHFPDASIRWGALGVNAFNRESHVAMDEVSDPPSARVVGSTIPPSRIYMTSARTRAQEIISSGELPEATAGMSGQVLIILGHELELGSGESKELTYVSLYNPGKLEEGLSEFGRLQLEERPTPPPSPMIACSEQMVSDAAAWAVSTIQEGIYDGDNLDRYEVLRALAYFDPGSAWRLIIETKNAVRRDGSLPHSLDESKPGMLETAVFLRAASSYLFLHQDKKMTRSCYPFVRKIASFLLSSSKDSSIQTDPGLPQGWRRFLGRGYPTGEIPEVSLAVAGALDAASQVARMVSKADDAGRFKERAELISERVRKKLLDDRGFLSLCRDSAGRLKNDETVDIAVAAYRHPFMASAEQSAAHRLLEKDFDTPWGPRCVPNSNRVYFNGAYGNGQLGGVWTRASLAFAVSCYRSGLAGMGSLAVTKVARLVVEDASKLGGSPGCFPQWVDVDNREILNGGSDPVAAARFLEALLEGELGFPEGAEKVMLAPATSSTFGWLLAANLWAGEPAFIFVGRNQGEPHLFFTGGKLDSKMGMSFLRCERLDVPLRGIHALMFLNPGQVMCLGNSTASQVRFTLNFPPRAAELPKRLSTPLEEFDPAKGSWTKTGSLRVSPAMSFQAFLEPGGWKAYRVSTP